MFLFTGSVPELQTEPVRIAFHLAAAFTTAALLVVGGLGVLILRKWGCHVSLLVLGVLRADMLVPHLYLFARQTCLPAWTKCDTIPSRRLAGPAGAALSRPKGLGVAPLADMYRTTMV
jgi:hypothetical protein